MSVIAKTLVLFTAVSPVLAQETLTGECMGTTWSVVVGRWVQEVPNLAVLIQHELDDVDRAMSTWKEDSEISRFNASRSTDWFPVSVETANVVTASLRVSAATDGAFDITVSPLIDLWNFDRNEGRGSIPTADQIEQAKQRTGYQKLTVRIDPPALRKSHPELSINLSAIAKGHAVDRVNGVLTSTGVLTALVEVGGEVYARGVKADGKPWTVGIEEPLDNARAIRLAVPLSSQAMATSGDYRNFYVVDGTRYSHTIDPRTGIPVTHDTASVSVIGHSCMMTDAWATALMVVGANDTSVELPEHLAALIMTRSSTGQITETRIGSFPADPRPPKPVDNTSSMWPVFLAAAIVFLIAVAGMAVGVIISNKRLKGSCGGLAGLSDGSGNTSCEICADPSPECQGENADAASATVTCTEDSA